MAHLSRRTYRNPALGVRQLSVACQNRTVPNPAPLNGQVSHWFDELPAYRPPLPGDRDADVCIVGAGYTGLWTAYYLKRADPSLRIAVLEARFAGFGASGRNGGWLSGLVPGDRNRMAKQLRPRQRAGLAAGAERRRRRGDRRRRPRRHRRRHRQGRNAASRPQSRAGVAAGRRDRGGTQLEGRRYRSADERRSSATDSARRRGVGLPQSALRAGAARPAGARAGRHRRATGCRHLRTVTGHRDRPPGGRPRRREPSPRRSCCGRRRDSPPHCPGCGGAGCR